MSYLLIGVALIVAIVDWVAVATQRKTLEYFAKPGVMLVLLIWLGQASGFSGSLVWFGLGLLFSMAGDIFLMLPRERFIGGLVAFLLAHVAYIVGFNLTPTAYNLAGFVLAVLVALVFLRVYRRIAAGLDASGQIALKTPVLIYSLVISVMLLSALLTLAADTWQAGAAILVSAGALLFFLSDTLLAWNKFVTPIKQGRLAVIITYHLGQILITVGATWHYLS